MKNQRKILNQEKGVTLITLVVTVAIMMIITAVIATNIDNIASFSNIARLENDIKALNARVSAYYTKNGMLPVLNESYDKTELEDTIDSLSINDGDIYYTIDLSKLKNIRLFYGGKYNQPLSLDKYIINEQSHKIYYLMGLETEERKKEIILPEQYQPVEYIESTGTQWIDTGVTPNSTTDIEVKFMANDNSIIWQRIYGQSESAGNARFQVQMDNNDTKSWYFEIGGEGYNISIDATTKPKTLKVISGVGAYVDGELVKSRTTTETNSYNIWLFRGFNKYSKIRIYNSKLWKSGTLVRNFIPCKSNTTVTNVDGDECPVGTVGLYDTVEGEFYTNKGTGTFSKGNDVTNYKETIIINKIHTIDIEEKVILSYVPQGYEQLEYIESTGTQWIDTGVTPNSTTDIEVKFMANDNSIIWQRIYGQSESAGNARFQVQMDNNDTKSWYFEIGGEGYNISIDATTKPKTLKVISGVGAYVDGELVKSRTTTETNSYNIWLFRGFNKYSKIRIYNSKLWKSGTLVRNFIPCKSKTTVTNVDGEECPAGTVGLYDAVEGKFYTNKGTGEFRTPENGNINQVHALLFDDGTLVFNRTGEVSLRYDKDKLVNVYKNVGGSTSDPQWQAKKTTITKVDFEEEIHPTSTYNWFGGCSNLEKFDHMANLDTSNVTTMQYMFNGCTKLTNLDLSSFNTSKVTNMGYMFQFCESLTELDVSNFDTSKVDSMRRVFRGCSKLKELDVSNFNTSSVTNMGGMFKDCSSLKSLDLANFDTSNVTEFGYPDIYGMFSGCSSLTYLNITSFNTEKVTDMRCMLDGCTSLKYVDLSSFVLRPDTNIGSMFRWIYSAFVLDFRNADFTERTASNFMGLVSSVTIIVRDEANKTKLKETYPNNPIYTVDEYEDTFTVSGIEYTTKKDLTWKQWVESRYNKAGFELLDGYIMKDGQAVKNETTFVLPTEKITANYAYMLVAINS